MITKLTFFSGTDTSTLLKEGIDRNNFVSLIVNNAGNYTAAITRRVDIKRSTTNDSSYKLFGEDPIPLKPTVVEENSSIVEWYNLKIVKPNDLIAFNDIKTRLEEIKENKRKAAIKAKPVIPTIYGASNTNYIESLNKRYNAKMHIEEDEVIDDYPADFRETNDLDRFGNKKLQINDNTELPFDKVKFNEKILNSTFIHLITGSIILLPTKDKTIKDWIKKMPEIYKARFGTDMGVNGAYRIWLDAILEYLIWNTSDDKLVEAKYDSDEIGAFLADGLITKLEKLKSNIYIDTMIRKLKTYTTLW